MKDIFQFIKENETRNEDDITQEEFLEALLEIEEELDAFELEESVELDEKAPKIDPQKYAAHMNRNKKAVRKTSASQDYIKDVQKRSNKMAREEIEESVELDEASKPAKVFKYEFKNPKMVQDIDDFLKKSPNAISKDLYHHYNAQPFGRGSGASRDIWFYQVKDIHAFNLEFKSKVLKNISGAKNNMSSKADGMIIDRLVKESVEIDETISDQKMEMLRKAYSSMPERLSIDQINKLKSVLSKFSKSELEQVKKAKINWLSSMAITLKASTQY